MSTRLVGKRVKLKPSVGATATSGVVRDVVGEGQAATYEIDAVDQTGYRSTLYLVRRQFTTWKSTVQA